MLYQTCKCEFVENVLRLEFAERKKKKNVSTTSGCQNVLRIDAENRVLRMN